MSVDPEQVQRAANALLKHMKESRAKLAAKSAKRSLDDDNEIDPSSEPIWMILTTKKHVTDAKRLKPGRMYV
jgi:ribosome biogenesis protein UTP30